MWNEFNIENMTINEVLLIIEDALCYAFEFKIEDRKLFYRELPA